MDINADGDLRILVPNRIHKTRLSQSVSCGPLVVTMYVLFIASRKFGRLALISDMQLSATMTLALSQGSSVLCQLYSGSGVLQG